jgi:hypothetical protein
MTTTIEFTLQTDTEAEMREMAEEALRHFKGDLPDYTLEVTGTSYTTQLGVTVSTVFEGTVRAEW